MMGVSFKEALAKLDQAAKQVYRTDPRIHAVGIALHDGAYGFRVIRNARKIVANAAAISTPSQVLNIPIEYADAPNDARSLAKKIQAVGPANALLATLIPEQQFSRPLVCGLQIQNFDDDVRQGHPQQGFIVIGTLGCFVTKNGDNTNAPHILSNNHVVAGENRGLTGQDRIFQAGSATFDPSQFIATLQEFVQLQFSALGATFADGTAILNDVDAGITGLEVGINGSNGYLPSRTGLPVPSGTAHAQHGDRVFKVGRTTGLTRGTITQVPTIVGPVDYDGQPAWFRNAIEIEGDDGTNFSDRGDSGSAIVKESTGEIVGLLFAGNGQQTYACAIDQVLNALNCSI